MTVRDENSTFEPVLCASGPEEIGQEGAESVPSSIQDGEQVYVRIDGKSLSSNAEFLGGTAGSFGTIPDTCP